MLEGESGHQDTLIRSEWVLKELENTKKSRRSRLEAAPETGRKSGERDRTAVDEKYPNQIEVIISNNDDMALGPGKHSKKKGCTEVQVVGIDGIEEVRELVDEDKILGSVLSVIQSCMQKH